MSSFKSSLFSSQFKGTVSRYASGFCCHKRKGLGLSRGWGKIVNFSNAPTVLIYKNYAKQGCFKYAHVVEKFSLLFIGEEGLIILPRPILNYTTGWGICKLYTLTQGKTPASLCMPRDGFGF